MFTPIIAQAGNTIDWPAATVIVTALITLLGGIIKFVPRRGRESSEQQHCETCHNMAVVVGKIESSIQSMSDAVQNLTSLLQQSLLFGQKTGRKRPDP